MYDKLAAANKQMLVPAIKKENKEGLEGHYLEEIEMVKKCMDQLQYCHELIQKSRAFVSIIKKLNRDVAAGKIDLSEINSDGSYRKKDDPKMHLKAASKAAQNSGSVSKKTNKLEKSPSPSFELSRVNSKLDKLKIKRMQTQKHNFEPTSPYDLKRLISQASADPFEEELFLNFDQEMLNLPQVV